MVAKEHKYTPYILSSPKSRCMMVGQHFPYQVAYFRVFRPVRSRTCDILKNELNYLSLYFQQLLEHLLHELGHTYVMFFYFGTLFCHQRTKFNQ